MGKHLQGRYDAHSVESEAVAAEVAPRAGRPDLEAVKRSLDFPPSPLATSISGYWRQKLLDIIDYAASLERELATARAALQQHADDPCECGPDHGAPSCVACYDRAALARGGGET